jgi:hypothetical protein
MGERNENLAVWSISVHTWKGFFMCHKIVRHGTSGSTSPPKEGVLQMFITLKNPSPRPGLNPWTLGPVASTLTTTPPRWLRQTYCLHVEAWKWGQYFTLKRWYLQV